ncbi:SDR family oxidoreductase [Acinetobacter pittii]|uniref:SDR family NAD(P)-dependent oxidoreductase n=1 Tax=Acinetobacter pittii TaxID=48296 RepID=UPI003009BD9E
MREITLITGTRKGIGKYLAHYYVKQGHIVIGCSREEIDWELENYHHIKGDVTNENDVKEIFKFVKDEFGYLDNLINNAGIASMNHFILTPLDTVKNIFNTNFFGSFLFCREAAKLMLKRKHGRIINFTTVASQIELEGESIYAASKEAIKNFTKIIARELATYNITVNSIGPTPVETDLIKSVPKDKMERLLSQQAIKRYGVMEDISNVIDFYLSTKSSFVTGQNIYLGGV